MNKYKNKLPRDDLKRFAKEVSTSLTDVIRHGTNTGSV